MRRIAVLAAITSFALAPAARAGIVDDAYEGIHESHTGSTICEEVGPYGEFLDNADEPWRTAGDWVIGRGVGCDEDGSQVVHAVDHVVSWFECTAEAKVKLARLGVEVCIVPMGEEDPPEEGPDPQAATQG